MKAKKKTNEEAATHAGLVALADSVGGCFGEVIGRLKAMEAILQNIQSQYSVLKTRLDALPGQIEADRQRREVSDQETWDFLGGIADELAAIKKRVAKKSR